MNDNKTLLYTDSALYALKDTKTGEIYSLNGSMKVGRSADCDIVLSAGHVSRHHATIKAQGFSLSIVDENSSNGTFVNNKRIRETQLSPGDAVRLDCYKLIVVPATENAHAGVDVGVDHDVDDDVDAALPVANASDEVEAKTNSVPGDEPITAPSFLTIKAPGVDALAVAENEKVARPNPATVKLRSVDIPDKPQKADEDVLRADRVDETVPVPVKKPLSKSGKMFINNEAAFVATNSIPDDAHAFLSVDEGNIPRNIYQLNQKHQKIGKSPLVDIYLEENSVSRSHADILYADGGWFVRDCGSTNSTFVNGIRVERKLTPLNDGDIIKLGNVKLVFNQPLGHDVRSGFFDKARGWLGRFFA